MPPLQPFVSNVPLQVAKNLRFLDDNNIPVTQMLPIGMVGNVVNDSPTTGYISRIGAVLSDQIDLYNKVTVTLEQYGQNITDLQEAVAALEISGNTIPNINGKCFTGNSQSPITTVVELMAESACDYISALGTTSELAQAIAAENASELNALDAYSIPGGVMAALTGWIPDPETVADSLNNSWLAYLDARAGLDKMLDIITPTCSAVLVDFMATYTPSGSAIGFAIYLNGYSFIPSGYTDNGSTVTITDGVGGVFTTAIDVIAASQPGADALFVGISGTPLSTTVPSYRIALNSNVVYGTNNCTKTVVHDVSAQRSGSGSGGSCDCYVVGTYSSEISGTTLSVTGLEFTPSFISLMPLTAGTKTVFATYANLLEITSSGFTITFGGGSSPSDGTSVSFKWIAFK